MVCNLTFEIPNTTSPIYLVSGLQNYIVNQVANFIIPGHNFSVGNRICFTGETVLPNNVTKDIAYWVTSVNGDVITVSRYETSANLTVSSNTTNFYAYKPLFQYKTNAFVFDPPEEISGRECMLTMTRAELSENTFPVANMRYPLSVHLHGLSQPRSKYLLENGESNSTMIGFSAVNDTGYAKNSSIHVFVPQGPQQISFTFNQLSTLNPVLGYQGFKCILNLQLTPIVDS